MNTRGQEQHKRFESLTRDAVTRRALLARRDCVHEKKWCVSIRRTLFFSALVPLV